MPYNEQKKQYSLTYAKNKLKRIPLDIQLSDYEELRKVASNHGESVNGFIKTAIKERIQKLAEE